MVASHILFQPRMALRETAKVFGMPDGEIGKITRRLPWFWHRGELDAGLLDNLRQRPETRHLDFVRPWPQIMALAQRIIGIPRHLSVHPGGVVITPDPIDGYVPLENGPQRGAHHPVGQGRHRRRRPGEDRSSGQPQPGGDPGRRGQRENQRH
jgi:DNA polymerase III alpha subunit